MTSLHRAGVAGLSVQLQYLDRLNLQPPHGLRWSLSPQTIELDWTGKDDDAIGWLCAETFQIDEDGLIYFPAIAHSLNFRQRLALHISLQKTFLQHNQFFKSGGKTVKEDRGKQINYRTCLHYVYQRATQFLCDDKGNLQSKKIKITGWIYPGATVKHYALRVITQFVETPVNFFALLFAPLACHYIGITANFQTQKIQTAIVIPEVTNLEEYRQQLHHSGLPSIYYRSAGWADAGLRCLLQATAATQLAKQKQHRCTVIMFGTVNWSKRQQTRVSIENIAIASANLAKYDVFYRLFIKRQALVFALLLLEQHALVGIIFLYKFMYLDSDRTHPLLQFIAANLIRGQPWWWGFADVFNTKYAARSLRYYRHLLHQMLTKNQWNLESQKLFITACHQALQFTFAKIYGKTKAGDYPQIERKIIQLRAELDRCQSAAAFRDFIHSFWGHAGNIPVLQNHWDKILPLTTGQQDWKMAKSLFFLALASYPTQGKSATTQSSPDPATTNPSEVESV